MRVVIAAVLCTGLAVSVSQDGWRTRQVESFDLAWSTINDTFYDPEFGGVDWAGVRDELRPEVVEAASPDEARAVTRRMLARLGRSHVGLMSDAPDPAGPAGGPGGLSITVRVVEGAALVTRVDGEVPLRAGDEIVRIGEVTSASLIEAAVGVDDRTRGLDAWRRVDGSLRGAIGSTVEIVVRRGGRELPALAVTRVAPSGEAVQFGNLPPLAVDVTTDEFRTATGRRVGMIAFNVWMPAINGPLADAIDRFRSADGLIIDLRGNPGGLAEMIRGVAGHVIDEPVVLGRMQTRAARLEFPVNPRIVTADGRRVEPFAGPVAILVDDLTASTSECFAGALQGLGRARVFGRPTLGQALPALTKALPSGDVLMYPIGDFEAAGGKAIEGVGVVPDDIVVLTPGALAGGDPDVDAALRWLDRF